MLSHFRDFRDGDFKYISADFVKEKMRLELYSDYQIESLLKCENITDVNNLFNSGTESNFDERPTQSEIKIDVFKRYIDETNTSEKANKLIEEYFNYHFIDKKKLEALLLDFF